MSGGYKLPSHLLRSTYHARAQALCEHTEGPNHDCAYVDFRNSKIFAASHFADTLCGVECIHASREERAEWNAAWTRAFHCEMNRLCGCP